MPFANYESFEACEAANSDKRDPGAYCAAIERQATGKGEWHDLEAKALPEPIALSESDHKAWEMDVLALTTKAWVPYSGPQGGEGWQNTETGDIVYDDEPPGEAVGEDLRDADDESVLDAVEQVFDQESRESLEGSNISGDELRAAVQDLASPEQLEDIAEAIGSSDDDDSPMSIEEMGEALADELGREHAENIFDQAPGEEVIKDYADVAVDENSEIVDADVEDLSTMNTYLHPEVGKVDLVQINGNPSIPMGPAAGYAITADKEAFLMGGGDLASDDLTDQMPPGTEMYDVAYLQKVQPVDEIEPDAYDVSEVDYSDYRDDKVVNTARSDETAPRLSLTERDALWDGIRDVTRDGADKLKRLHKEAKKKSYSAQGQTREKAFLEAAGLGDLAYRNDIIQGSDPDEATVAAAEKFMEASQQVFSEVYGDSTEVHRGISKTAFGQLIDEHVATESNDETTFETFGLTNYSTEPGVAEKFGRSTATISREVGPDEVLSYTDALYGGMQEGEISVKGGKQTIPVEHIKMRDVDGNFVPMKEALENPHKSLRDQIRRSASEEAQEALL